MRVLLLLCLLPLTAGADEYVNGYFRQDGTYVAGYYRTVPDGQRWNNYTTQGNTNPYTGQRGYERPYPAVVMPPMPPAYPVYPVYPRR